MPDDSPRLMYETASWPNLPLGHGVGPDRHIRAFCECGAEAVVDPAPWMIQKIGGLPLKSFGDRMRCACGARTARLEIWYGPERPSKGARLYVFR